MGTYDETTVVVCMTDDEIGGFSPIVGGRVRIYRKPAAAGQSTISAEQGKGAKRQKSEGPSYEVDPGPQDFTGKTGADGCIAFSVSAGYYRIHCEAFGLQASDDVAVETGCTKTKRIEIPIGLQLSSLVQTKDCEGPIACLSASEGTPVIWQIDQLLTPNQLKMSPIQLNWKTTDGRFLEHPDKRNARKVHLDTTGVIGDIQVTATLSEQEGGASVSTIRTFSAVPQQIRRFIGDTTTTMTRTETDPTDDLPLWVVIRNSTEALSFNNYLRFMDWIFCGKDDRASLKEFERGRFDSKLTEYQNLLGKRFLPFTDADAYRVVKAATEAFVMVNCGIFSNPQPFTVRSDRDPDEDYLDRRDIPAPGKGLRQAGSDYLETVDGTSTLPYLAIIRRKLPDISIKTTLFENAAPDGTADSCFGILQEKLANPCLLELIWSYWHEEGMLVQSMNAITRRFQNVRAFSLPDPLSNLEMDPLRPLNNLFWGYIQDEQHRLTIGRRNYEYDHHYGLQLEGRAVRHFRPADTRSKFLEAFHHLLRLCTVFYKQDDDTTVKADAFPVLNALKETHLILSEGAHNQFGDLPSTARVEMLMQEWLLARPEFREYLPTRIMVAYPEPWMDRVDAMKKLQGWSDTSVVHFRNLGIFGEQLLLSIRWGAWSDVQEPIQAFNWARFFRPQVQGYIHAYRAVTGVDLAAETVDTQVDATLPSVLLKKRLAMRQRA